MKVGAFLMPYVMIEGWIRIHRKLIDWEWYSDTNVVRLFLHCLLKANHKDKKWRGVLIKKGSFITSYEKLSMETGISVQSVRTSLKKLKSTSEVTIKTTNLNTCISINKWKEYQEANKQSTNNQQTANKQLTTTNNEKNLNNNNKRDYISIEYLEIFNTWLNYKKERKQTYKSETSIKTAYNNLIAISGNKSDIAKKIVNQSIANNWSGLFELKQKANNSSNFIKVPNDSDY